MQAAAWELQFSETVFAVLAGQVITMRFFTPTAEVSLCGHAALAMLSELWRVRRIASGIRYTIGCRDAVISGYVSTSGVPYLKMPSPQFGAVIAAAEVAPSLGLKICEIGDTGCRIVNAGLPDIFIGVRGRVTLENMRPDYGLIAAVSRHHTCTGYHVFDEQLITDNVVYCRNFAPLVGINEETATGTANCALACLLAVNGLLRFDEQANITAKFVQGMYMNNTSEIIVKLIMNSDKIEELWLSGATRYFENVCGG